MGVAGPGQQIYKYDGPGRIAAHSPNTWTGPAGPNPGPPLQRRLSTSPGKLNVPCRAAAHQLKV